MFRSRHLFVLLSLFAAQAFQVSGARVLEGCAQSFSADDKRATQIARVSALSAYARETGSRMVSAHQSVVDGRYTQMVAASSVAAANNSRIVATKFFPGDGGPGRLCVSLEFDQ